MPELDADDSLILFCMLHDHILQVQNKTLKQDTSNPVALAAAAYT